MTEYLNINHQKKYTAYHVGSGLDKPSWLQSHSSNLYYPIDGRQDGILTTPEASRVIKHDDVIVKNPDETVSVLKMQDFEKKFKEYVEPKTYSYALEKLIEGLRVARKSWHGGDQVWVQLVNPQINLDTIYNHVKVQDFIPQGETDNEAEQVSQTPIEPLQNSYNKTLPCFALKTIDDDLIVGWLPSIADQLGKDWFIVE